MILTGMFAFGCCADFFSEGFSLCVKGFGTVGFVCWGFVYLVFVHCVVLLKMCVSSWEKLY